ncbi:MAG: YhbY family RNA-binding protein [Bacilli bacterium]
MLNNKQIKYLRGLANSLDAKYQIGKNEISDQLISMLDKALTSNELIKISLQKSVVEDKNEIASILQEALKCEVVQIIGGVIILFRKNLKDGKIHLPR